MLRLAVLLLLSAALVGCGDDSEPTVASPEPTPPPAIETATVPPTETATPSPTATDAPTPENPEDQPGGAGDEEPVRVPVEFRVSDRGVSPRQVSVPAFLGLELIVHNGLGDSLVVRLEGAEPMTVGPGQTGRARLEGRRKGQSVIDFGSAGQAVLLSGAEPGP